MSSSLAAALAPTLSAQPPWPDEGAAGWAARARGALAEAPDPFAAAASLGARADRVAYAFAGGYQAALWALVPGRDRARLAALCVTEAGGGHPRAIEARADTGRLTGEKTYVTLGALAEDLYVLAREGESDGRPRLGLYVVDPTADGVVVAPGPSAPFVPEIDHATLRLDGARGSRLEGDGWSDYARPFRTVEDVHVHGALLAHLLALGAREGWERPARERGLALLAALASLAAADPAAPTTHLALAGALDATRGLVETLERCPWPDEARARWDRDRRILEVAASARGARVEAAWTREAKAP